MFWVPWVGTGSVARRLTGRSGLGVGGGRLGHRLVGGSAVDRLTVDWWSVWKRSDGRWCGRFVWQSFGQPVREPSGAVARANARNQTGQH